MVQLSSIFWASMKGGRMPRRRFLDSLRIFVKGGNGGMGMPKFGGIGGKGGDIYVTATEEASLKSIVKQSQSLKRFAAPAGGNSRMHRILGEKAKDLVIECPVGITILTDTGHKLGELDQVDNKVLVARGGQGGCAENQFCGQRGQAHSVTLDLKLIADVGMVGFPNAGKSSLLKSISRASPTIASYPFTTIAPNIGIVQYDDLRQISVADLPGLIEGAHGNVGLGHRFLKHVERTKILLFVVDIHGFQLKPQTPLRTAFETVVILNKELEMYREDLTDKPAVLVVNKMDIGGSQDLLSDLLHDLKDAEGVTKLWTPEFRPTKFIQFDDVIPISAKEGLNTGHVITRLRQLIDLHEELKQELNPTPRSVDILLKRKTEIKLM